MARRYSHRPGIGHPDVVLFESAVIDEYLDELGRREAELRKTAQGPW